MTEEARQFTINIDRVEDMQFKVDFDWDVPDLLLDEPVPMGSQEGPNAARLVAAAVGNCLCASLLFCLQKARVDPGAITAEVTGTISRNDKGRLRLTQVDAHIKADGVESDNPRLKRCLGLFEDFCVVTQALRDGIEVDTTVTDGAGNSLV